VVHAECLSESGPSALDERPQPVLRTPGWAKRKGQEEPKQGKQEIDHRADSLWIRVDGSKHLPAGRVLAKDRLEIECPVCGLYRVERQFWVTAHFKKVRQPVLYRRLAWWLAESRERAQPPEIPFEGWEGVAELRSGT
jgi:hypothetical protein